MKRLFALLLICLLPMQVFAGMLTSQVNEMFEVQQTSTQTALQESQVQLQQSAATAQLVQLMTEEIAQDQADVVLADDGGEIGDTADTAYNDVSEDFSTHAGIGDEPALNGARIFVADSATLAPVQCNDDARQPPFLPPAARPPMARAIRS